MSKPQEIDEQKERKIIALGEAAKRLLEDEAFIHVCQLLEKTYWEEFKRTALTPEARANVQAKARVLDDVRATLDIMMDSGTTATIRRDKRERTASRE